MDDAAGMTGEGGQEGASPCAVVSMDDAAGMTRGGQEGASTCAAIFVDDAAGMIVEGGQEENLSPSHDNTVVHGFSLCCSAQHGRRTVALTRAR